MKVLFLFALVVIAFAAPQPKKIFHEHVDDFLEIIYDEAGVELEQIMIQYVDFEEFQKTLAYVASANYKDLVYEMEAIPEFKAKARQTLSGRDFNSYIKDTTGVFPKEKLAALYTEDEDFKAAIEGLQSDEWKQLYSALWANELFLAEVSILAENGIDIELVIEQLFATFGQKYITV
ncbi:hypothetical protein ABMA28_007793 [Loxostege sticticalis]|uniref:Uncharacterized protein n=1 Tax=Loxostege sticticalis TaxID=481309 RepID=A0ABD0SIS1_LOXSC